MESDSCCSLRWQLRQERLQRHHCCLGVEIESLIAGVQHDLPCRVDVFATYVKASARLRITNRAFDLDRPTFLRCDLQHKVNLCSDRSSVEPCLGGRRNAAEYIFDEHPFPARSDHRMPQQHL